MIRRAFLIGKEIISGSVWALDTAISNLLDFFFLSHLRYFFSEMCANQFSAEDSRNLLCRWLYFFHCATISSVIFCLLNSSCFGLPRLLSPSLLISDFSLCSGLKTLFRQQYIGPLIGVTSYISLFSNTTVVFLLDGRVNVMFSCSILTKIGSLR